METARRQAAHVIVFAAAIAIGQPLTMADPRAPGGLPQMSRDTSTSRATRPVIEGEPAMPRRARSDGARAEVLEQRELSWLTNAGTGGHVTAREILIKRAAAVLGPIEKEDGKAGGSSVDVEVEAADIGTTGNQLNVREYDRRKYSAGDLRKLELIHFADDWAFLLDLSHPLTGSWQDATVRYQRNDLGFRYDLTSLAHNQSTLYQSLVIDSTRYLMFPADVASWSTAGEGSWNPNVNRRDMDLGFEFYLNRQEHDMELVWSRPTDERLRVAYWAEHEYGLPELWRPGPAAYSGFSTVEHPQTSFKHPTNRLATELEAGGSARIRNGSVHATYFRQDLDDDTPDIPLLMRGGNDQDLRQSVMNFPERRADGFRAGFTVPLGQRAKLKVQHVARDRRNAWNGYKLDMDTFTTSVSWDPSRDWALFSQVRDYDRRTLRNEAYLPVDSIASNAPLSDNRMESPIQGIFDESNKEFEFHFRYLGFKDQEISAGYRTESWKRPNSFRTGNILVKASGDGTGHTELIGKGADDRLLLVHEVNARDGFWIKTSGNRTKKLSYRTFYERATANRDFFTRGTAQNLRNWSANVSYDFRPDLTAYVEALDEFSASSQEPSSNTFKSISIGGFGTAGTWGLGAHYTHESFDTRYLANWQQPLAVVPRVRGFVTGVESYTSRNDVYNLNLLPPRINDHLQLELDLTHTNSRGYLPVDYYDSAFSTRPQDILITGTRYDDANAVNVGVDRLGFKARYALQPGKGSSSKSENQVGLEYSYGRWEDAIDSRQTGRFDLASLTYRRRM